MDNHRTSLLKRKQTRRQEEEPSFKRHRKPEAPSSKGHWKPEDPSSKRPWKPEDPSSKGHWKPEDPSSNGHRKPEDPSSNGHRKPEDPSSKGHRKPEDPSSKGHWKPEDPSSKGHRKPEELSPKKQRKAEYPYVISSQDADFRRYHTCKSRQPLAQTTVTRTTAPLRRHTNKPRDDEASSSTASSHTRRLSLQDDARESELSAVRHQHTRRVRHWGNERHDKLVMTKRRPLRHNHSTLQRELSKLQHNQSEIRQHHRSLQVEINQLREAFQKTTALLERFEG